MSLLHRLEEILDLVTDRDQKNGRQEKCVLKEENVDVTVNLL